ncbi:hypothetical protein DFH09DRAFT_1090585 [Mycena vulgaris]|nr:hypothetical protein DFH09DRAFT_1090585 [Mycena vulgaris]
MPTTFILPDILAIFEYKAGDQPELSLNPNFAEAEQAYLSWYQTKASEWPAEYHEMWIHAQIPLCTAYHCPRASIYHLGHLNSHYTVEAMMEGMTDTKSYACIDFDINILCPLEEPFITSAQTSEDPSNGTNLDDEDSRTVRQCNGCKLKGPCAGHDGRVFCTTDWPDDCGSIHFSSETFHWHALLFDLMRWASGVLLGDAILRSAPVQKMTGAACELITLTNNCRLLTESADLCSYKKEMRRGEALHNLMTVCMLDPATDVAIGDLQAAAEFVGTQMSHTMQELYEATDAAITQCPQGFGCGNYFWQVDPRTVRYSVFTDAEARKARKVTIP